MNEEFVAKKLAEYAACKPTHFLQIHGAYMPKGGDEFATPDCDGDFVNAFEMIELMNGETVRALIPIGFDAKIAARQLRKAARLLKRNPQLLKPGQGKASREAGARHGRFDVDIPF